MYIGDNHIKAKIDSHNKIVYASKSKSNKRNELFKNVLLLGEDFERDMIHMKAVFLYLTSLMYVRPKPLNIIHLFIYLFYVFYVNVIM